jgi:DNA-directed RNA polymerase subunit H (RpoH/RPB5)
MIEVEYISVYKLEYATNWNEDTQEVSYSNEVVNEVLCLSTKYRDKVMEYLNISKQCLNNAIKRKSVIDGKYRVYKVILKKKKK